MLGGVIAAVLIVTILHHPYNHDHTYFIMITTQVYYYHFCLHFLVM